MNRTVNYTEQFFHFNKEKTNKMAAMMRALMVTELTGSDDNKSVATQPGTGSGKNSSIDVTFIVLFLGSRQA